MSTSAAIPSATEPAGLAASLGKRIARSFKTQVEDWHDVSRELSAWEHRELVEHPSPEKLREHAAMLDELERVGRLFSLTTTSPDFHDRGTAELVALTLQDLRDRRALWHPTLDKNAREKIIRDIFNES